MNAWDHLPNAKHIDRVLASVKTYPQMWATAYNSIKKNDQYWLAQDTVWGAEWNDARTAAWNATWDAAHAVVRAAGLAAAAFHPARDAVLALIEHDDCAYMLDSDPSELAILAAFGDSRALLLQSACIAFNKEKELV